MTFRKEGNTSSVPHIKQFDFSELIEVQQNASRVLGGRGGGAVENFVALIKDFSLQIRKRDA